MKRKIFEEKTEAEFLPLNCVMKVARLCVPRHPPSTLGESTILNQPMRSGKVVKFSASFQVLLQQCIAEFIQVIAAKLHMDRPNGKRTFTDEDVLRALEALGIEQYSTTLRLFMTDYREMVFDVLTRRLNRSLGTASILPLHDG